MRGRRPGLAFALGSVSSERAGARTGTFLHCVLLITLKGYLHYWSIHPGWWCKGPSYPYQKSD